MPVLCIWSLCYTTGQALRQIPCPSFNSLNSPSAVTTSHHLCIITTEFITDVRKSQANKVFMIVTESFSKLALLCIIWHGMFSCSTVYSGTLAPQRTCSVLSCPIIVAAEFDPAVVFNVFFFVLMKWLIFLFNKNKVVHGNLVFYLSVHLLCMYVT